jgi:hypothetical protein
MNEQTRLGMLKSGVGLLAGAVGLGVARQAAALDEWKPATFRLTATNLGARVQGRSRGRPAKLDDHISTHGQLVDRPDGVPVGVFAATSVVVHAPFADRLSTLEQHLFTLHDGTITGSGRATDGVGTFAITGGTGRYTGARGTYSVSFSPFGFGGDGTAHFDFTLTS